MSIMVLASAWLRSSVSPVGTRSCPLLSGIRCALPPWAGLTLWRGYWGCFHCGVIKNKAVTKFLQKSFCGSRFLFLVSKLEMKWLDHQRGCLSKSCGAAGQLLKRLPRSPAAALPFSSAAALLHSVPRQFSKPGILVRIELRLTVVFIVFP